MKSPKSKSGDTVVVQKKAAVKEVAAPQPAKLTTLYLHIKNPDDREKLSFVKSISTKHPGSTDVVMVLGDNDKTAIRLPFRVDENDVLISELVKALGEDCVTLK